MAFTRGLRGLRAGLGEDLEVAVGPRHHQVHVAVERGFHAAAKFHDIRPEREVGDEVRVHDVQMERVGARLKGARDVRGQRAVVGGEQRWKNLNGHDSLQAKKWSGRWESNPRKKLGKLLFCH